MRRRLVLRQVDEAVALPRLRRGRKRLSAGGSALGTGPCARRTDNLVLPGAWRGRARGQVGLSSHDGTRLNEIRVGQETRTRLAGPPRFSVKVDSPA